MIKRARDDNLMLAPLPPSLTEFGGLLEEHIITKDRGLDFDMSEKDVLKICFTIFLGTNHFSNCTTILNNQKHI